MIVVIAPRASIRRREHMPVSPIIIAGVVQVRVVFSLAGITANVVHYVSYSGALTLAAAQGIADQEYNAWNTHLKGRTHTLTVFAYVTVTDVRTYPGLSFTKTYFTSGTLTGDFLPPQTAAVITWRTGLAGRSYRGRSYMCGFNEADSAGQSISATLITALGNYATKLRADLITNGHQLQVGSRLLGIATPVNAHVIRAYWRTQRRRINPY